MERVSIIVPAYNCASYLKRCLDSLVNQSYPNLEILVVNDGSTDETVSIIREYNAKVTLLNKENGGVASARNFGMQRASGEFILFVDSDDYLDTDCVEQIMQIQRSYDADIVRFSYRLEFAGGKSKLPYDNFAQEFYLKKEDFSKHLYCYFFLSIRLNTVWATLYRSSILRDLNFRTDLHTAEDACFNADAYTRANSFVFIPAFLYHYYQNENGLTGTGLSIFEKYRCNAALSRCLMQHLKVWNMNTFRNRMILRLRIVWLTFDKLLRKKR